MNKMLNILVVDDEPLAVERLCELLQEIPNCHVIGKAANSEKAWQVINTLNPDLVLLDIAMPGESGLQLAARIQTLESPPLVVFCTAYDEYALKAFDAHAIDYLLKPIRRERLLESVERASRLKQVAQTIAHKQFVTASVGGVLRRIALADIFYLHAEEKYTVVHHRDGEHILDQTLKDLEHNFPGQFIRIHRNCLVKQEQVNRVRRDTEGHVWAILNDVAIPLEVSRRCASELKEWFKNS
jgi:two-component system response regulator AlgR